MARKKECGCPVIEVYEGRQFKGIMLIERGKAPFGKAIPGGKVEYGETVENAIRREMMEEVNLELNDLRQFHVYSDPTRNFRHHSVEVAHVAKAYLGLPLSFYNLIEKSSRFLGVCINQLEKKVRP